MDALFHGNKIKEAPAQSTGVSDQNERICHLALLMQVVIVPQQQDVSHCTIEQSLRTMSQLSHMLRVRPTDIATSPIISHPVVRYLA
jgi:hypothetical protein